MRAEPFEASPGDRKCRTNKLLTLKFRGHARFGHAPSFASVAVHFIENFLQMLVSMPEQLNCVLNAIICAGFANCIQLFSEICQLVNVR